MESSGHRSIFSAISKVALLLVCVGPAFSQRRHAGFVQYRRYQHRASENCWLPKGTENFLHVTGPSVKCNLSGCAIKHKSWSVASLLCSYNEVQVNGQCYHLAKDEVIIGCYKGALSIKLTTISFGEIDKWNAYKTVEIEKVKYIKCSNCPDNCIFAFGTERSTGEVTNFPTNSLCTHEGSVPDDLSEYDTAFVCKVPSGNSTVITGCLDGFDLIGTLDNTDDITASGIELQCVDGELLWNGQDDGVVDGRVHGPIFAVHCNLGE